MLFLETMRSHFSPTSIVSPLGICVRQRSPVLRYRRKKHTSFPSHLRSRSNSGVSAGRAGRPWARSDPARIPHCLIAPPHSLHEVCTPATVICRTYVRSFSSVAEHYV